MFWDWHKHRSKIAGKVISVRERDGKFRVIVAGDDVRDVHRGLDKVSVRVGDRVTKGVVLGKVRK
jgi:hypothetical protein